MIFVGAEKFSKILSKIYFRPMPTLQHVTVGLIIARRRRRTPKAKKSLVSAINSRWPKGKKMKTVSITERTMRHKIP